MSDYYQEQCFEFPLILFQKTCWQLFNVDGFISTAEFKCKIATFLSMLFNVRPKDGFQIVNFFLFLKEELKCLLELIKPSRMSY